MPNNPHDFAQFYSTIVGAGVVPSQDVEQSVNASYAAFSNTPSEAIKNVAAASTFSAGHETAAEFPVLDLDFDQ